MGICNVQVTMTFPASPILRSQGWGVLKEQPRFASSLTSPRMMMWGNMWTRTAAHLSLLQVSVVFTNFHLIFIGIFIFMCQGTLPQVSNDLVKGGNLCTSSVFLFFQARRGVKHPRSRDWWPLLPCRGSAREWLSRSRELQRPRLKLLSTKSFWHSVSRNNVSTGVRVWQRNGLHAPPLLRLKPQLRFCQVCNLILCKLLMWDLLRSFQNIKVSESLSTGVCCMRVLIRIRRASLIVVFEVLRQWIWALLRSCSGNMRGLTSFYRDLL